MWTGRRAAVSPVHTEAAAAAERFIDPGSTSASTGCAPAWRIAFTVAQKVIGVVTTESPLPMPAARRARKSAAVPEFTDTGSPPPT